MKGCPNCGSEMEKAADWPDDWLVCLNCLYSEKAEFEEGQGLRKEEPTTMVR